MKVELNLVDQYDRPSLGRRVIHRRIGLRQAAGQVEHQGQHAPLTVRE